VVSREASSQTALAGTLPYCLTIESGQSLGDVLLEDWARLQMLESYRA